ncbi:hypothetical protein DBV15_04828 [Temnothorax longispinosus]|uniref:Uncharacterized protein n=1 Tax=Temnothorax longispinosus TaxID=300112 RepID=A0A4S2KGR7_9HYME|nr:hypothetical protein DBV15_04828 [Temnothorax longispinosus]
MAGSLPRVPTVSPVSDWSPAACRYLPTYLDGRSNLDGTWTVDLDGRRMRGGRAHIASHRLKGAEGEIQDS